MDNILRGSNFHEKEYIVTVDKEMPPSIYDAMEQGVPILNTITRPCKITKPFRNTFHITLTQGLNRQIRRMCEAAGMRCTRLRRIQEGSLLLGNLPCGAWRYLTAEEVAKLK